MASYSGDSQLTVTTDRDGSRSFGDHDNRWSGSRYSGRGYKKSRSRGRGGYSYRGRGQGQGSSGFNPRSRHTDFDGDVEMDSAGGNKARFNPYGGKSRNRNRRDNGDGSAMKRLGLPLSNSKRWTKVFIPHGKKCEKSFILKAINGQLSIPFEPVHFHYEGNNVVFYVKDNDVGHQIKGLSKRTTMPNGYKLVLHTSYCDPPIIPMTDEAIKKLQERMSDRYEPSTRTLNLSSLFNDEALRAAGFFLAINKSDVMSNVIKIVKEKIPELAALDLSNNRLYSLTQVTDLLSAAPGVTSLNLGQNQLRMIEELDKIRGWKLDTLVLDKNDLCDRFKDNSHYISAVRKRFPKVMNLDGNILPAPITFDLEPTSILPSIKGSVFINEEIQNIVVKFLREFFFIYDSDNRQPLLDAYHEMAFFSMTASINAVNDYKQSSFSDYVSESRNFLKCKEPGRREKLLKQGKLATVSQLCDLPPTTHDPNSFLVDVCHASSSMLTFSISGIFKETDHKVDKPPIRSFNRIFYTIPAGSGMVITNDMLTISNATASQIQGAFKSSGPTPSSSPVTAAPPLLQTDGGDGQQMMIEKFSLQSGMNAEWSRTCLSENAWNYDKAASVFTNMQNEGKIPAAAFVK